MQFPENFLDYVFVGRCIKDEPSCSAPEGEFADVNMWSRSLTEEELGEWTGCRSDLEGGDLIDWRKARFETWNMTELERPMEEICNIFRPSSVLFPELKTFYDHVDTCYQMSSAPTVVRSQGQLEELGRAVGEAGEACQGSWLLSYWSGWWDEPEEGVVSVPVTGEVLRQGDFAPFKMGTPRGGESSNCMSVRVRKQSFMDEECTGKLCGFCDIAVPPKLNLRGTKKLIFLKTE